MDYINNITEAIGRTPLMKLNKIGRDAGANVFVKLEYLNPSGSYKDRMALAMVEAAERGDYLAEHYDLEGVWEDAAVYTASGADVREIAVVLMEEDDDANGLKARMEDLSLIHI